MKFIFAGSTNYDNQSKIISGITNFPNLNQDYELLILCGNNSISDNKENVNYDNITDYLNTINVISNSVPKFIMFGNDDLNLNSNQSESKPNNVVFSNIVQELNWFKTHKDNFTTFNNVESRLINNNTLIIFFDSIMMKIKNPDQVLVNNTGYKYLFDDFSNLFDKEHNQNIKQLIEYQFEKIINIIESNSNIINIIFVTQEPFCSVYLSDSVYSTNSNDIILDQDSVNKKVEYNNYKGYENIDNNKILISWFAQYYNILSSYKITFLSGGNSLYQYGKIDLSIWFEDNYLPLISINQYILGNGFNTNKIMNPPPDLYEFDLELLSEYTGNYDKIKIKYNILDSSNSVGILDCVIDKANTFIFVDVNNPNNITLSADNNNQVQNNNEQITDKSADSTKSNENTKNKITQINQSDKSLSDKSLSDKSISDKLVSDKLVSDKSISDKLVSDKLVSDKSISDKSISDKSLSDKSKNIKNNLVYDNIIIESDTVKNSLQESIKSNNNKSNDNIDSDDNISSGVDEYLKKYTKYKNKLVKYRNLSKNESTEDSISSSNDPYKARYIKYKNKLLNLRNKSG